jgi:hypothetical protein
MPILQQGTPYSQGLMTPSYGYGYNPAGYTQGPMSPQRPQQPQQGGGTPIPTGLLSTLGKKTGAGQAAMSGVNSFGQSIGFGAGAQPASFVGPMQPGALGTTSSLGSVAGAAGLGYIGGGMLAKATGGNQTGGSIGGAIGGALGSYAAGTATGLAVGAAFGIGAQALNFIVPGLGIIVGGLAGSLIGNKKPATRASDFAGTIDANEGLANVSFGSKNAGQSKSNTEVQGAASDYYKELKAATGIDLSGNQIRGGFNSVQMGGGYLQVDQRGKGYNPDSELGGKPQAFKFNVDDPVDRNRALGESAVYLGQVNKLSPEELQKIEQFNAQRAEQLAKERNGLGGPAGALQASGVPMIGGRQYSSKETFADFYTKFKQQQEQGKAV